MMLEASSAAALTTYTWLLWRPYPNFVKLKVLCHRQLGNADPFGSLNLLFYSLVNMLGVWGINGGRWMQMQAGSLQECLPRRTMDASCFKSKAQEGRSGGCHERAVKNLFLGTC